MSVDKKVKEIIAGLLDLAEDRKSFFREDGDDEIFRHDYAVLHGAASAVQNLQEVINNPGLGLCVICQYGSEGMDTGRHCSKCKSWSCFKHRLETKKESEWRGEQGEEK